MQSQYKPKSWYIKLIHIAKSQLQLDDDLYRANLKDLTGFTSCSAMTIPDLVKVLEHMKRSGFKTTKSKAKSPKSSDKAVGDHNMLDKLRQIWIQMHYQGFITNGSEQALQAWAANQSKRLNKGVPITQLEWLKGNMLFGLIEQLKKWHMRLLAEVFAMSIEQIRLLSNKVSFSEEQIFECNQIIKRYAKAPQSHDVVSNGYSFFLDILKQYNAVVEK